jgi:hypothetical protein
MKTAYELALERLERQGMRRPEDTPLTDEDRHQMADIRTRAEAKLAELDILRRDKMAKSRDPSQRQEAEEYYQLERKRIEEERERKLEAIRKARG